MKFKESNKQKFYMRNVYINQIMKPQIQNNLNYAYFENPQNIPAYCTNQTVDLNQKKIFNNNKPIKTFYQNYIPNQIKSKKGTVSFRKSVYQNDENLCEKMEEEINDTSAMGKNKKKVENCVNERSFSENKSKDFNQTYTVLKNKEKKNENLSYLRVNQSNHNNKIIKQETRRSPNKELKIYEIQNKEKTYKISNNDNTSSRNSNSNKSLKKVLNNKKYFYNERNKKQNIQEGKNTYFSEYNKNSINQINKIINLNNACTTSPNSNNNSYTCKINDKNNNLQNNNFSGKPNIKSYKYYIQNQNFCCKSVDKTMSRNSMEYKSNINNYKSPNRIQDEFKNIDDTSTLNSPSVPSYSSIIEDNSNNSKNYVWVKKNIKNNKSFNYLDNNYLNNFYKKPNINKDNIINQNLIKFANDITNINSSLYNTEIYYQDFINKDIKLGEEKNLYEHSATLIQSVFRGYLVKRKFDILYDNYKYYYNKGIEILELILDYFFKKSINVIEEKQRFFKYLKSLKRKANKAKNKSKINQKPKSYKNFGMLSSHFSPSNYTNKIKANKYYQDLFLHKEIGERFNIIKENNIEKDMEKNYKDKLDVINMKLNKLINENNKLKDINEKNVFKESRYREMSKDNKKKDDIINIITNDNKILAKKLKIIQDKFNKLQIQNQDYINYNSDNEQNNCNYGFDLFEEYRNLYLEFLIYKIYQRNYLSIARKYLYKFKNIVFALNSNDKANKALKQQKLKCIINNSKNKNNIYIHHNFLKFHYKSIIYQKEIINKNNLLKNKLVHIISNKEKRYKSILRTYFHKFYYKGIILYKNKEKRIIDSKKCDYKKIINFLSAFQKRKDKYYKNMKREYFIKWHLITKVLALKALINDKRRKKRQKQKLKKKNENETTNKYLNNNKILHFGKSNIYILNKDKEKELLISLDKKDPNNLSKNENMDNKYNNVIQATEKLGEIFYRAAQKHNLLKDKNEEIKKNIENENTKKNEKDNIDNNNIEEEEDSGDSLGI